MDREETREWFPRAEDSSQPSLFSLLGAFCRATRQVIKSNYLDNESERRRVMRTPLFENVPSVC